MQSTVGMYGDLQGIAGKTLQEIEGLEMRALEATGAIHPTADKYNSLFSVSLTGEHDIPINKRGSGTRRLVLLNFFCARAEKDAEGKGTGIIYAIEEPETSQHPNNQKMLIEAFEDVPVLFAQAVHEASGSDQSRIEVSSNVEKLSKKESSAKRQLCTDYVSRMTPDLLSSIDTCNEIRTWLCAIGVALQGC